MSDRPTTRPWGVHELHDMFDPSCQSGLPNGRYVYAVAEPYTANRLVAAWWVLTGRAYALHWPRAGDVENALGLEPHRRRQWLAAQQAEAREGAALAGRITDDPNAIRRGSHP